MGVKKILFFIWIIKQYCFIFVNTIKPKHMTKQVLKSRLMIDCDMIISVVMLKRTEKTAFIMIENGEIVRCKIRTGYDGKEYVMPYGTWSMAPMFDIN